MPYTMSIPIVYLNADLFRAAGLDPSDPPSTVEDVKAAALKIKATGAEGVYYSVVDSGKSDFMTQSVVNSNGGSLVDAKGGITLDAKPAVDALATLRDLTKSGAMPAVNTETALAAFTSGKLGMLVGSSAVLASAMKAAKDKFELPTAGFPTFGSKPEKPTYSGAGLAVLAKDDQHKRAAWEFVKFATSEAGFEKPWQSCSGSTRGRRATATDRCCSCPSSSRRWRRRWCGGSSSTRSAGWPTGRSGRSACPSRTGSAIPALPSGRCR
ncbi:extracellular solute-binding protein [Frankia sp. EI5c]|uniref:extracellular solute-binding protein n=1 Tax=Frankia sp. EI5c TaxID=683316 RepID=UPI0007C2805C|nr:extracellular solute-binding protein [Frankia sp. EI5c]